MINVIYAIGGAGFGLIVGLIITLFADEATFRRLENQNECLRLKVSQLEKEKEDGVQVIEITDNRPQPDNYFTPF